MTQRYFVDPLPLLGGEVLLGDDESQHAIRVMRLRAGDRIELFDGHGHEAAARVIEITRRECVCEAEAAVAISRESLTRLHLAIALPKPDRAKEMVERLTELGVDAVTPVLAQRTQRPPTDSLIKKLRRTVIEASKQCGRNQLLRIEEPESVAQFLRRPVPAEATKWILHTSSDLVRMQPAAGAAQVIGLIGPEGGWTEEEIAGAVDSGYLPVSLGSRVLRVETAAAALAAITAI